MWNPDCTGEPCECPGTEVGTPPPDEAEVDETGITVFRDGQPIIRLGGKTHEPTITLGDIHKDLLALVARGATVESIEWVLDQQMGHLKADDRG